MMKVLKESRRLRNLRQLKMISLFIEKTKIYTELIHSFSLEREASNKILLILAKFAKHVKFEKGKEIFKLGDPAENFFIIFSGSIQSFKLSKQRTFMTRPSYIKKLFELKSNNDIFILRKTLSFNRNLDINEYEIDRLHEKLVKIEAIKHDVNLRTYKKLFISNKYEGTYEKYLKDVENGEVPENITDGEIKSKLYENSYPSPIDIMDDDRVFDPKNHKAVLFFYELVSVLKEGDYFGQSGENPNRRKHYRYYIPQEDSICLSISNGIFQRYISCEIQKMQNKEILFLNDNHIFNGIQRGTFLNNYLKYFSREEFVLGNVIFQEEQVLDKIFFLKEGKIELSLNTNFLTLNQYANELLNAHEDIKANFKEFPFDSKIKNQPKFFMENLKKKQHYSIFLLSENDLIGLEECRFDFKRLCTACVKSDKALLYSIPIKKFKKIIELEPKAKEQFMSNSLTKMINFLKRLVTLKNNNLHFLDSKYSDDFIRYIKTAGGDNKGNNANKGNVRTANSSSNLNNRKMLQSEENNGSVKESIKKYFNEFNDLSKHLKKKYELILNPQHELYTFYNDFNYEKSTIKNIKKEIDNLENNSINKILPDINLNSNNTEINFNIKVNNIRNINTDGSSSNYNYTSVIPKTNTNGNLDNIHNKNNSPKFLENINSSGNKNSDISLNNTINGSKRKHEKNSSIFNSDLGVDSEKSNIKLKFKSFKSKNSTLFMTHHTIVKSDSSNLIQHSYRNNESSKTNSIKINQVNESENKFSTFNNYSKNRNPNNNDNPNSLKLKKNSNSNWNLNISQESSNNKHVKNNKSDPFNIINYDEINENNNNDKNSDLKDTMLSQNLIKSKVKTENFNTTLKMNLNSNKNIFVPFSVDNSINSIKNQDKRLQMAMARRLYKNQSLYNLKI